MNLSLSMSNAMFTGERKVVDALKAISSAKLKDGIVRGSKMLIALPNAELYSDGEYSDYESFGHPNFEMRETNVGQKYFASGFARLRLSIETAMVDSYQELKRRGEVFDTSSIILEYLYDWQIPKERIHEH